MLYKQLLETCVGINKEKKLGQVFQRIFTSSAGGKLFLASVLCIRTRRPIINALTIGVMTLLIINAMPQVNNNPKKQK